MMDRLDTVYSIEPALHAHTIYEHPRDVLADSRLTKDEKRALLASWASDAAAVPSQPRLRRLPGSHKLVSIDDILSALDALDHPPRPPGGKPARVRSAMRLGALPIAA
jgi:hypothetical protein